MSGHITSDSEAQMVASRYINLAHMQTRGLDLGYLYELFKFNLDKDGTMKE